MRHGNKGRKLKRTASHRAATLNSLATSLLRHKKIRTTEAKAKETRIFVEPIITRAKNAILRTGDAEVVAAGLVHARREVARQINDADVVKSLFAEIAPRVATRAGGYTRVVKLGNRHGDNAAMAIIELVDFTEAAISAEPKAKAAVPRPTRNKEKTAEAAANAEAPKKPRATRKKKEEAAA